MIVSMLFPGEKPRAFTISYDDGVETDFRLADLMRKHQIKGTFNVNSGVRRIRLNEEQTDLGQPRCRFNRTRLVEFYEKNHDIAEIAAHGLTHGCLSKMEQSAVAWEVLSDRKNLEEMFSVPCRGFAYPYGDFTDEAVEVLRVCGFQYARTTQLSMGFSIPKDPLRWACTCRHKSPELPSLAKQFLSMDPLAERKVPYLFSVWGHSYEFEMDHNWHVIEELFDLVGNRQDVWYCTNIELFRYVRAYQNLEFSASQSMVYNPSSIPVSLMVFVGSAKDRLCFTVNPGETISIR